jgi:acylpyruvate hydrolase
MRKFPPSVDRQTLFAFVPHCSLRFSPGLGILIEHSINQTVVKTVQIKGTSEHIPVSKIICIGQNYSEHIKEMKAEPPTSPVFFLKPTTAIVHNGGDVVLPSISHDVHHEVELTVLIGKDGSTIPQSSAVDHIAGYGIGLDMTLRDIQAEAKKRGLPWTLAKGFDTSAPISDFVPVHDVPDPASLVVHLTVNGSVRQHAGIGHMVFPVNRLIAYVSRFVTLERGDIIFTGTPQGVSRVQSGDLLEASLASATGTVLASLSVHVR